MKKVICLLLVMVMSFTVFTTPVVATEVALQEDYSTEELLAMDQTLDSDGDGVTDVLVLIVIKPIPMATVLAIMWRFL